MTENLTPEERSTLLHWSLYGRQPGETATRRVTAEEWKAKPFTEPVTSKWNVVIQPDQLPVLLNGFRPQAMEEKWFVYADNPNDDGHVVIHFHRSWTGNKVAQVNIEADVDEDGKLVGRIHITEIVWESSSEILRSPSEQFAQKTVKEVCRWVLGVQLQDDEK